MINRKGRISGIRSRHIGIPMLLCIYLSKGDGIKYSFWVDILFVRFGRRPWGRKKNDEFYVKILWPLYFILIILFLGWLAGLDLPRLLQI